MKNQQDVKKVFWPPQASPDPPEANNQFFWCKKNTPDAATLTVHHRNSETTQNIKLHVCDFRNCHFVTVWGHFLGVVLLPCHGVVMSVLKAAQDNLVKLKTIERRTETRKSFINTDQQRQSKRRSSPSSP